MIKSNLEITQRVDFSCSYISYLRETPLLYSCTYKFEVTVMCPDYYTKSGSVMMFEDLKDIMKASVPDRTFIVNTSYPEAIRLKSILLNQGINVLDLSQNVTTESLLNDISLIVVRRLAESFSEVKVKETKLRESPSSYATWIPRED